MSWTWEQISGRCYDSTGALVGVGYSGGECGLHPDAVNNPAQESMENVGPLPAGIYSRGTLIEHHPRLGRNVIPLIPDAVTRAKIIGYGRGPDTFYWHGDDVNKPGQRAASDGCLISAPDVRLAWYNGPDPDLQVVAKLPILPADLDSEIAG